MNSVHLLGRIANELEPKYLATGTCMTRVTVAVNRPKKKDEAKPQADFIDCIAWGKTAETIGNYFKKGDRILIDGKIQTGSYENKEGKKVKTTDVFINGFEFVDAKSKQAPKQNTGSFSEFGEEDIMF